MKKLFQFRRIAFDVAVLFLFLVLLFLITSTGTQAYGFQLILLKGLLVSAGVIHAHIVRKIMFPYIDFNKSKDPLHKTMVIGLYLAIIFAWSRGG